MQWSVFGRLCHLVNKNIVAYLIQCTSDLEEVSKKVETWAIYITVYSPNLVYTEKGMLFLSPSYLRSHQGSNPLSPQFWYVSSMFSNCIQNDLMSQRFSLSIRFKKPRPILLYVLDFSHIINKLMTWACLFCKIFLFQLTRLAPTQKLAMVFFVTHQKSI